MHPIIKFIVIFFFVCSITNRFAYTMIPGGPLSPEQLLNLVQRLGNTMQDRTADIAVISQERNNLRTETQVELRRLTAIEHPTTQQTVRINELQGTLAQLDRAERQEAALNDIGIEVTRGLGGWIVGSLNRDNTIAIDSNRIRTEGIVQNHGKMQRLRATLQCITDPKTLTLGGLTVVGGALSIMGGHYGTKLAYEQLKMRLGVPELVEETSRQSTWQNVLALFKKKQPAHRTPTEEIILSDERKTTAQQLAEDTKETNMLHLPYQNLLLYGPPGTGKTAFAKKLAYYSDMDYAILSGSRFAQFDSQRSIIELFKIFQWAENNKRGTILFIDEADACFRDRKTLDQNGINFVNAFLSKTGASSDKFMFIFASNYETELDAAILSRIHKKINFPLPDCPEREKILHQKISKYITHDQRVYTKNGKKITETLTVDTTITSQFLQAVAQKIDGFSGRDIEYAVLEMRMRAYRSVHKMITKDIVNSVINEKIADVTNRQKIVAYQNQKTPAFNEKTRLALQGQ
jgi:AAA+ superfamily predicted ATPase